MSDEVKTSYVLQFSSNVELMLQEKGSKLRDTVTVKEGIVGKAVSPADQIAPTKAQKTNSRNSDSPIINTAHDRRWYLPQDYDWGTLVDKKDNLRMLIDPQNAYVQNASLALGRSMDDEVLENYFGTNYVGEKGETKREFDTNNIVAESGKGFNVDKLIAARQLFRKNNVDLDFEQLFCLITSQQEADLLHDEKYINGDYGKGVLDDGRLKAFMGFNFIIKENLPTKKVDGVSKNVRRLPVYTKSGVGLGIWQDKVTKIEPRADKKFNNYIYLSHTIGASRLMEGKCLEIECQE